MNKENTGKAVEDGFTRQPNHQSEDEIISGARRENGKKPLGSPPLSNKEFNRENS